MKYIKLLAVLVSVFTASLFTSEPAQAAYVPNPCQGYSGKIICASKAQGRVLLVNNGRLKKSAKARFGGKASDGSGPWSICRSSCSSVVPKESTTVANLLVGIRTVMVVLGLSATSLRKGCTTTHTSVCQWS